MNHKIGPFLLVFVLMGMVACSPTSTAPGANTEATPGPFTPDPVVEEARTAPELPETDLVPTTVPGEAALAMPLDAAGVQFALSDLSSRLGIPAEDITVTRAEPVTWADGSLGCPQPDMMYTQALVDGVFIQLQVGEDTYSYHGSGNQDPILCESAARVAPGELPPGAVGGPSS